jgi:hypothetical protein
MLAGGLNNLSNRLAEQGYHGEALTTSEEAVAIYDQLNRQQSHRYLADLALALNNVALRLSAAGPERRGEAFTAGERSVLIYRELVQQEPGTHRAGLARALDNHGVRLGDAGLVDEGLRAGAEAVLIYRELADADSDATPLLAGALNNLALTLGTADRPEQALSRAEESLALYRQLERHDSGRYLLDVAMAVGNLDIHLRALGRWGEALGASREAARHYRRLADRNAAAFLSEFSRALNNLAQCHLGADPDPRMRLMYEWVIGQNWTASADYHRRNQRAFAPGMLDGIVENVADSDLLLVHAGLLELTAISGLEEAYTIRRDPVAAYRTAVSVMTIGDLVTARALARVVVGTTPGAAEAWRLLSDVEARRNDLALVELYATRADLATRAEGAA